jgi:hypothetical protein
LDILSMRGTRLICLNHNRDERTCLRGGLDEEAVLTNYDLLLVTEHALRCATLCS